MAPEAQTTDKATSVKIKTQRTKGRHVSAVSAGVTKGQHEGTTPLSKIGPQERTTMSTRWLGTRYAMIRWVEYCRIIRMSQVVSAANCGDLMTTCLVGPTFFRHRATVLWTRRAGPRSWPRGAQQGRNSMDFCM